MNDKGWVSLYFMDSNLFTCLDCYLDWKDLIHLTRVCRNLYHEWITKYPKRWKHLRTLQLLCFALGMPDNMCNPLVSIRARALRAFIRSPYKEIPCMGGCGHSGRPVNPDKFKYCICKNCAMFPMGFGYTMVKNELGKIGMTQNYYYEGLVYARSLVGNDKSALADFEESWKYVALHERYVPEWGGLRIYSLKDVHTRVRDLFRPMTMKFE